MGNESKWQLSIQDLVPDYDQKIKTDELKDLAWNRSWFTHFAFPITAKAAVNFATGATAGAVAGAVAGAGVGASVGTCFGALASVATQAMYQETSKHYSYQYYFIYKFLDNKDGLITELSGDEYEGKPIKEALEELKRLSEKSLSKSVLQELIKYSDAYARSKLTTSTKVAAVLSTVAFDCVLVTDPSIITAAIDEMPLIPNLTKTAITTAIDKMPHITSLIKYSSAGMVSGATNRFVRGEGVSSRDLLLGAAFGAAAGGTAATLSYAIDQYKFGSEDCRSYISDLNELKRQDVTFQHVDDIVKHSSNHFREEFIKYLNTDGKFLKDHYNQQEIKTIDIPYEYDHPPDQGANYPNQFAEDLRQKLKSFIESRSIFGTQQDDDLLISIFGTQQADYLLSTPSPSPKLHQKFKKGLVMTGTENTVRYYTIGDKFQALSGAVDKSNVAKGIGGDFKKVKENSGVILSSKVEQKEEDGDKKIISIIINNSDDQSEIIFHDKCIEKLSDDNKFYFKLYYEGNKPILTIINNAREVIEADSIKGGARKIFNFIDFEIYCKEGEVESKFVLSRESKNHNFSESESESGIEDKKEEIVEFAKNSTETEIINQELAETKSSDVVR